MGAALGSFLADEWLEGRCLISEGPPIPSPPLCLSHGPIKSVEQLSDGLITSALDFNMDFYVADQSIHRKRELFREHLSPHAPMLKEIDARK
ncbi:hypothetical protein CDAR_211981 [Caerostris darwini]|uniref:Uncharacterized protein n=1 Tax=Caerostris darwini TaxID=1538125 RepID=A0AAV4TYZ3_9ARAC|nr:hypothetical protein CDAR_211981 [Caerostris darwini]